MLKPVGPYGFAYGTWLSKETDNVKPEYNNLFKDLKMSWIHNTLKVKFHETEQVLNNFESKLAETLFGAKGTKFEALQFHFHSPSEHTINGKHTDLEIHIVHKMKMNKTIDSEGNPIDPGMIQYGVVGLLFDVHHFDQTITAAMNQTVQEFIHELKLADLTQPKVEKLNFGEMMSVVDF